MATGGTSKSAVAKPPAGGGRPLDGGVRDDMESAFGSDLSGVRVHDDTAAARSADAISARAYAMGDDVYFGSGAYQPATASGRQLLAHELTHTLQDDRGPRASPAQGAVSQSGDRGEQEADAVATQVAAGNRVDPKAITEPRAPVARQAATETEPAPSPAGPPAGSPSPTAAGPARGGEPIPQPPGTAGGAAEPVALDAATFAPSPAVAETITTRGTEVPVRFRDLARGTLLVRRQRDQYSTTGSPHQGIPLTHPFLEPLHALGITPVLAVQVRQGTIRGYVSVARGGRPVQDPSAILNAIKDHEGELGWVGLDVSRLPRTQNSLEGGLLRLRAQGLAFSLGGFLDGSGAFGLENETVTFSGSATVRVRGLTDAQLEIERTETGTLYGRAEVPVELANFSGNVVAEFGNGTMAIEGTAGYRTEKLSGQVTLLVTDAATARSVAMQRLGPDAVQASAEDAAGAAAPERGPRPGPRALAGWGSLEFAFSEWLTGTAQVIIDNEGHITVVGEIAPPAEIELFPQRDWVKNLFTIEVRTLYGVPLVGNVFLFANIGMDALAKLGPGRIYDIRVGGTYSTDPQVFNAFSIQGTLNISAYAGLRLRAEGGVGVEVVGHDIKAGAGVNALAGIRGYVEATPTVGYRETADPDAGRQGEWYLRGHLEIAAQPFLGLGGDLFVELDSPWWSPAPDKKWTWPLGELEYPLPGEFGIGADVDYVIGSGEVPEISFGEVDFDKDRFMTDLMNDQVPPARGGGDDQAGEWSEEPTGEMAAEPTANVEASGGATPDQPAQGRQTGPEGEVPPPGVDQRWAEGMRALGGLVEASRRDPYTQTEIDVALAGLKGRYGFTRLTAQPTGAKWAVHAEMNPSTDETRIDRDLAQEALAQEPGITISRPDEPALAEASAATADYHTDQDEFVLARGRTTTAMAAGSETFVGRGGSADVSAEAGDVILRTGASPATYPDQHAEVVALNRALQTGMPDVIVASRPFCPWCRSMLIEGGATLVSETEADLSSTTRARMRAAVAEEIERRRHMSAGEVVRINSDSVDELERLHGVGPALAARIFSGRSYETDEDLLKVTGIGPTKLAGMRDNPPSFNFR